MRHGANTIQLAPRFIDIPFAAVVSAVNRILLLILSPSQNLRKLFDKRDEADPIVRHGGATI